MLEYIKDWRMWLICVVIVIIIENPIAGWCFERQKSVNWITYAENVLQLEDDFEEPSNKVFPSLWHDYDPDPSFKTNKKKHQIGFKAFSVKWAKLNAIQTRFDAFSYLDLRCTTKFDVKKLAPKYTFENIVHIGGGKHLTLSNDISAGRMTPMATFSLRW